MEDIPDDFYAMGLSVICAQVYGFPPYYEKMNTERANWASEVQQVIDNSFHMEFSPTASKIWDVIKSADEEALAVNNDTVPVRNDYQAPLVWGNILQTAGLLQMMRLSMLFYFLKIGLYSAKYKNLCWRPL